MVVPSGEMAPGIGTSATAPTLSGNTSSKRATGSGASPVGRCHSITTAIATAAMAPSAMAANVSSTGSRIRSRRSGEAAACDRAAAAISDAKCAVRVQCREKAAALPNRSAGSLASACEHRVLDVRRHRVANRCDRRLAFGHHACDDGLHRRAGERRLAGERLVRHDAQRINVRSRVDCAFAHGLFGAHVLRRAEREACLRHAGAARALDGERDAEIGDERVAALQQNVFRLDVAVNHAEAVGVAERIARPRAGSRPHRRPGVAVRVSSRARSVSPVTSGIT